MILIITIHRRHKIHVPGFSGGALIRNQGVPPPPLLQSKATNDKTSKNQPDSTRAVLVGKVSEGQIWNRVSVTDPRPDPTRDASDP